ncbi:MULTISPECIES: nucleotide pyrophosphohydrolase [Bacteria]|jgi:NTP pyrophosphatase (non-canonical NTP hydrolase)|uniref:nucleotide pyrophosphohydrolase n=1 Tax=Bacteria TaxID=2 RepID=UPI0026F194A2|nr:nucleotide pyrophosphohydrolase [Alkalibaculum bacchi]
MNQEINNLVKAVLTFRDERDWKQFHSPKNLAVSISIEAAELLELFQWLKEDQSISEDKIDCLRDEIADVFIYLLLLSHTYGIDVIEATQKKILKNHQKYPIEKARGNARKYTEF